MMDIISFLQAQFLTHFIKLRTIWQLIIQIAHAHFFTGIRGPLLKWGRQRIAQTSILMNILCENALEKQADDDELLHHYC